jgi:hypothetical protein
MKIVFIFTQKNINKEKQYNNLRKCNKRNKEAFSFGVLHDKFFLMFFEYHSDYSQFVQRHMETEEKP